MSSILTNYEFPNLKLFKKGKVRNVYEFSDTLLIVATDRISAFDYVLPQGIEKKGEVLTKISEFWFNFLKTTIPNHMISTNILDFPKETQPFNKQLKNRSMLVKRTNVIPIECVVRGYLVGSGWKEYQQSQSVCGIALPNGLQLAQQLPMPIFTPTTKADTGHDESITLEQTASIIGSELTNKLKTLSINIYNKACAYALQKGIIIADTKFEFGLLNNEIILIDEVLTPDSSRFWPKNQYQIGTSPISFDKQIVRDYLEQSGWNKQPPAPNLPTEILKKTSFEYQKIYNLLTT